MSAKIRELNDRLRRTFAGGRVMMTAGIAALPELDLAAVLERVRSFAEFNPDNDPHGEHDLGRFELAGRAVIWKIDYFDARLEFGSEDPADPAQTTRVLTIMLASEY
jgi:hypothetical protein